MNLCLRVRTYTASWVGWESGSGGAGEGGNVSLLDTLQIGSEGAGEGGNVSLPDSLQIGTGCWRGW